MFNENQLKVAIKVAFETGRNWGVCYQGWFSPNDDDHEKHYQEAEQKALEAAQQSVQSDGACACGSKDWFHYEGDEQWYCSQCKSPRR